MSDGFSIAALVLDELTADDKKQGRALAAALVEAAIGKNVTAIKQVVDLIEPPKPQEEEPAPLTLDELCEKLDQFARRTAARRDQPVARS